MVLLALLSKYEEEQTEAILRLIVMRLKSVCKSEQELSKYLQQLQILARLRKLENETYKIVQTMPITYNVENDGLYLMGVKTGIERGIERGIEKGIERGILKMILRALEKGMSYEALSELSDLSVDAIKEIDEKRLDGEFKGFTQQDDHLI